MIILIISQIIAVIIDAIIAFSNNKKKILILTFSFNLLNFFMYFLKKDQVAMTSYILIISRSFIYLFQDKLKKYKISIFIPLTFILLHIILGLKSVTTFWNLLPIIAPCIVCYLLWFEKKRQNMRLEQALSDLLWFIHNIYSGLYIVSISRIISISLGLIAYKKNFRKTKPE